MKSFLLQYSSRMGDRKVHAQRGEAREAGSADEGDAQGCASAPLHAPAAALGSQQTHVCAECKKEFTSLRGVTTHIRQVHEMRKYGEWTPNM